MINFIEKYDWLMSSQLLLIVSISITILFYDRLRKYSEFTVSLPFSLCLGLSIYSSNNLISYFFFSEVIFNLSKIIYDKSIKQYSTRYFENVRYIFWSIILFTYHYSFGTFEFNKVPKNTGIEYTFVIALLISLMFVLLLNFVLRKEYAETTISKSIGYEIFTISIFCLKTILILSDMTDSILPKHHFIIDILILVYIISGCLLSLKFYKSKNLFKLKSLIRALIIFSLFPLLTVGENPLWDKFTLFSMMLVIGFIALELVINLLKTSRMKALFVFILICFLSGIGPYGHIFTLFGSLLDNDNQVILLAGIACAISSIAIISKQIFALSYERVES